MPYIRANLVCEIVSDYSLRKLTLILTITHPTLIQGSPQHVIVSIQYFLVVYLQLARSETQIPL